MKKLFDRFKALEKFVCRWWYGPLLSLLAGIDHFVIVIPTIGLMVSSVLLAPRRWLVIALWTTFGSWLGLSILGYLAQRLGFSFIAAYFPAMLDSAIWNSTHQFFAVYGSWVVFFAGLAPFPQQPPVIIAAIAGTPMVEIGAVLLIAKLIKFGGLCYLASHAPQKLSRFGEVREELDKLHVEPPPSDRD